MDLSTSIILFKVKHKLLPLNVQNIFTVVKDVHSHNTRQNSDFNHAKFRTVTKQQTVKVHGPKLWSSIPLKIKQSKSLPTFKKTMKSFLINK